MSTFFALTTGLLAGGIAGCVGGFIYACTLMATNKHARDCFYEEVDKTKKELD